MARFTSFVAIASIAAGVASLIVAQSLSRGFADEMRGKTLMAVVPSDRRAALFGVVVQFKNGAAEVRSVEACDDARDSQPTKAAAE